MATIPARRAATRRSSSAPGCPRTTAIRIPPNLRDNPNDPAKQSWANRAIELSYVGRTGIDSCSPTGPGGFTGCFNQIVQQARAERRGGRAGQLEPADRGGARRSGCAGSTRRPRPRSDQQDRRATAAIRRRRQPYVGLEPGRAAERAALRRDIGFTGSAFLSFNGMVGAGHLRACRRRFTAQFGAFSPWLFPLFGLLFLLIALPLRPAGRRCIHESGGPVAYAAPSGRLVSFQAGWLYYLARITALAANANVFATYAASLWPPLGRRLGRGGDDRCCWSALLTCDQHGRRRAGRCGLLDAAHPAQGAAADRAGALGPGLVGRAAWPPPGPLPPLSAIEAAGPAHPLRLRRLREFASSRPARPRDAARAPSRAP